MYTVYIWNIFIPNNVYNIMLWKKNQSESLLTSDIFTVLFKNRNYLNTHPIYLVVIATLQEIVLNSQTNHI